MKLLTLFIAGISLIIILSISCSPNSPTESDDNADAEADVTAEAIVTIVNWGQTINWVTAQGDTVYDAPQINYKVENTGQVDIISYEVYFRVETINGKAYEEAGGGGDLKVREIDFKRESVFIDNTRAKTFEITGQFLQVNSPTESNDNAEAEAEVTIVNWGQTINWVTAQGDTVYNAPQINYKVENTGQVDIISYEVYFRVETINGKTYEEAGGGGDLKVREIDFKRESVFIDNTRAKTFEITGQFLQK